MERVYIPETFSSPSALYVDKTESLKLMDDITPALALVVDAKEK
jgi:hypothetical protein